MFVIIVMVCHGAADIRGFGNNGDCNNDECNCDGTDR